MPELRFLVVGCGGMGGSHSRLFSEIEGCRLVSFVDKDESRAKGFCEKYGGLRYTTNFDREVSASDVDVVVVTTWPSSHVELAIKGLEAGKHVFTEKPMSDNLASARRLANVARKAGGKFFVGYPLRHFRPYTELVRFIREGAIGFPLVMRMNLNQQTYEATWLAQKHLIASTSPVIDCGVHYVDIMRLACQADAVEVYATGIRLTEEIAPDKYNWGMLQVKFSDGSRGFYEAGWGPMMSRTAYFIKDFIGPKGSISLEYYPEGDRHSPEEKKGKWFILWHEVPKSGKQEDVRDREVDVSPTSDAPEFALIRGEDNFFVQAIREDRDLMGDVDDALKSLQIVLAADESIRTGRVVHL